MQSAIEARRTYQSPQSVMSITICWGAKNLLMSQDEDPNEADGVPHPEGSMVLFALVTDSGTLLRYDRKSDTRSSREIKQIIPSRTRCYIRKHP